MRHSRQTLVKKELTKLEIKLVVEDRVGLLRDVSEILSRSRVNILAVNTQNDSASAKFPVIKIVCSPLIKEKAEKLMVKIKKLKEVREVGYRLV